MRASILLSRSRLPRRAISIRSSRFSIRSLGFCSLFFSVGSADTFVLRARLVSSLKSISVVTLFFAFSLE